MGLCTKPKSWLSICCTFGMREEPPARMTSQSNYCNPFAASAIEVRGVQGALVTSDLCSPASFRTDCTGSRVLR